MHKFHYLSYGLGVVLVFVGGKMMSDKVLEHWGREIPTELSLGIVLGVLAVAIVASLLRPADPEEKLPDPTENTAEAKE